MDMIKTNKTKTVFFIGFGDIAKRAVRQLRQKPLLNNVSIFALVRQSSTQLQLDFPEVHFVQADLDDPALSKHAELRRLFKVTQLLIYLAPPPATGKTDPRLARILSCYAVSHPQKQRKIIYISTTGVYGNCFGAWVPETRPLLPQTDRARRRVAAEKTARQYAKRLSVHLNILRVPGIYAADRLPLARLQQQLPVIVDHEDSYTNHIHAEDLARSLFYCAHFGKKGRIYHIADESQLKMGQYFDLIAACHQLPLPPRLSRAAIQQQLSPIQLSFLNESRRIATTRLKKELRIKLLYPTISSESLANMLSCHGCTP